MQSCGSFGSCKTELSVVWLNQHNIFIERWVMWLMGVNIFINCASVWFFSHGCYIQHSRVTYYFQFLGAHKIWYLALRYFHWDVKIKHWWVGTIDWVVTDLVHDFALTGGCSHFVSESNANEKAKPWGIRDWIRETKHFVNVLPACLQAPNG